MNETMDEPVIWRSLLYVPANNPKFIDKAHMRGADAIILDLEDACPVAERPAARSALSQSVATAGQSGADVTVRINRPEDESSADLDAAVIAGVRALFIAKSDSPDYIRQIDEKITALEKQRGLPEGKIALSLLIESPGALRQAVDIGTASPRAITMSLGGEDFATEMHAPPTPETLELPKLMCLMATREAGLTPIGFLGTVADFTDLEAVRPVLERSRKFGFEGASCIHPGMIPLLNETFAPTLEEAEQAERIVTEYAKAQAEGKGAITIDGKMIDVPVAVRAEQLLARHRAIAARQAGSQTHK